MAILLVRVASAGGIGPVEVDPVDDGVEGLHEAERAIGHARPDEHGKEEHQQEAGASLVRRPMFPREKLF